MPRRVVRDDPPPGRAAAPRPSRGAHLLGAARREEERGFALLPAPDAGDVWLDIEGHPFYEPARGLEYLFGYCYRDDDGDVVYDAVWGRDRDGERAASSSSSTGSSSAAAATPACTSTTTPPTSAPR